LPQQGDQLRYHGAVGLTTWTGSIDRADKSVENESNVELCLLHAMNVDGEDA
jgi:hypothetical protein